MEGGRGEKVTLFVWLGVREGGGGGGGEWIGGGGGGCILLVCFAGQGEGRMVL